MPSTRSTDQIDLAYRTTGEGPVDVVFLHGWAGSGAYFTGTVDHLDTSGMRVVTMDFRGHGDSGDSDDGYTLDQVAEDVIAVADAIGADRFVLVGFSMSGKYAQYVTASHPDRILGQVLVAGCPAGEVPLPAELLEDWYGRAGDAARLIEITQMFASQPVPPDVLDAFGRDAARVPLVALRGTMEAVTSTSFVPACTPTVVVDGKHDAIFSPDALRDGVAAPIPGARLEVLDCGHEIPVECPQQLAELINEFVAEVWRRTDSVVSTATTTAG